MPLMMIPDRCSGWRSEIDAIHTTSPDPAPSSPTAFLFCCNLLPNAMHERSNKTGRHKHHSVQEATAAAGEVAEKKVKITTVYVIMCHSHAPAELDKDSFVFVEKLHWSLLRAHRLRARPGTFCPLLLLKHTTAVGCHGTQGRERAQEAAQ